MAQIIKTRLYFNTIDECKDFFHDELLVDKLDEEIQEYIAINFVDKDYCKEDVLNELYDDITDRHNGGYLDEELNNIGYEGDPEDFDSIVDLRMKLILENYKSYNVYYGEISSGIANVISSAAINEFINFKKLFNYINNTIVPFKEE